MELLAYKVLGERQLSLFKDDEVRSSQKKKNHGIYIHDKNKEIPDTASCVDTNFQATKRFCAMVKLIDEGKIELAKIKI